MGLKQKFAGYDLVVELFALNPVPSPGQWVGVLVNSGKLRLAVNGKSSRPTYYIM